ncbi:unnamed protein product [Cuscuta campestris]|uniref:Uncharacterized protein n=1 Tax=Cuscuta campestris TaxID=132261 RepID=A0A484NJV1_9ASTE|nr:unnamed protein product [Cuscuta campestris]
MAAASVPWLQFPAQSFHSNSTISSARFKPLSISSSPIFSGNPGRYCVIRCTSWNEWKQGSSSTEARKVEKVREEKRREEKRRAELYARIASGEFTAEQSGISSILINGLARLGVPRAFLEYLFKLFGGREGYPRIPEAKGSIKAIRSEAFFIPLYGLYRTYGGIFRLTIGPKVFFVNFYFLLVSLLIYIREHAQRLSVARQGKDRSGE